MSLAVTGSLVGGLAIGLRVEHGRIAEIGPDIRPAAGDQVLDGAGTALVRGLVNGHTHAAMTLFRGYGDDMPLIEWLEQRIWPAEAKLTDEDVYWGTRLACVEMIRTGTIAFWDMYWRAGETARAVADAGIRAVIGAPLIDRGDVGSGGLREAARAILDEVAATSAPERISGALAPHAIYTVSAEGLGWVAETAAERELPVHIHLSETESEVAECVAQNGVRPVPYLDGLGLLGPRTVLAHGVWVDEAELDLIAERGVTVVTNPVANMKLAVGGPFPYLEARQRGVRVGLGTDGAGSNNSLDLLADAKHFALIQKHAAGNPAAVTAEETWAIATGMRSPLLATGGYLVPEVPGTEVPGTLFAAGEPADFLLVRADSPELTPGELIPNLVYAASGSVVDTTVVAGRVLMRGGVVDGADEVREQALAQARRLGVA
ncbi:MAG: amidohydrolase [Solirubrobacterales bacterium]